MHHAKWKRVKGNKWSRSEPKASNSLDKEYKEGQTKRGEKKEYWQQISFKFCHKK